ncbi:M24 family metallopeptidase [Wolbachia endosymbiont of Cruorifilaria tuberocauda]|uniref:aminopeptidase P family protein n=1 Tax=Wolbachia endosymbiont of Cruorifilaria tuberocauda TaxID=1812111 RepID=UPI00158A8893|nr:aminopeptidase P family protein [Wolbachia endosymbiont of Cruorifilaria tuberocauda]QKX01834.1 M24 family metallopeptidase [Wolbachia endosymbiont of Cruorifilaria tuberocauda]
MSKLEEFRSFMCKINVDVFMLRTNDEYLNEHSDELTRLCGFTGTNGLLFVTKNNKCIFFTDSRYIMQVHNQIDLRSFQVYNIQEKEPCEWVKENLTSTTSLGYYLQYSTAKEIRKYEKICRLVPYSIKKEKNHKEQMIVSYTSEYSGESSKSKCERVIKSIDQEIEAIFLADPNSISWLLNLRNENAKYNPCILGSVLLYRNGMVDLFIQDKEYSTIQANLDDNINILDASELESSLCKLNSIMIDPSTTPMSIMNIIQSNHLVVEKEDPCLIHKAIKNKTEIVGAINAHIRDGVAVTNFLCWLENNVNKSLVDPYIIQATSNEITELNAEARLLKYRKEQALFKQSSFPTISAFNENGAIIHYRSTYETNKVIQKNGLYLIDSGGQYLDGTTDVTRAIAIGNPTNEQITHYTIVLKAHIAIASAIFPFSTTGGELDILARVHLWRFGIDYMHGTGHGVGSYLSVHEGPQAISKGNEVKLMPGMILSNEPGYYIPGKYGIRIENLMYVNRQENGLLNFKQLTSIPYDRRLICQQMLTKDEIKWINNYHKFVYKNLKNNVSDKKWLKKICAPLQIKKEIANL